MLAFVHGQCACGRVQFEAALPTSFVSHCHCHHCRQAHGAAFVTWAGFAADGFRVTAGAAELREWHTDTGATRQCGHCGCTMSYASPRWAGDIHLAVACLQEELDQAPGGHAYADRAPAWCPILDELPQFGGEDGVTPLSSTDGAQG